MPIGFIMSVHLHLLAQLPLCRFLWSLILETFITICEETPYLFQSDNNTRYFTWRPLCVSYCWQHDV